MNKLLTWNIRHGGGKRIEQIIGVLQDYLNTDFIVLTEVRNNGNFSIISKFFEAEGYDVYFDYPEPGLNSVLIATRSNNQIMFANTCHENTLFKS